jgi:hypothetical protein
MKIKKNGEVIDLTESDLKKIVSNLITESDWSTGVSSSERTLIVQDVIDRINEHGLPYILALRNLNSNYNIERRRTPERTYDLPSGVRVQKSVYPENL